MNEDFELTSSNEENDVLRIVPLANAGVGVDVDEPGQIAGIEPSKSRHWSIDDGVAKVGLAHEETAGLALGLLDYDALHEAQDGMLPLPVYAKNVATESGKVIPLSELTVDNIPGAPDGSWQAATVASCKLQDGTKLSLKVYTSRNGDTLHFELTTGEYFV